MKSIIYCAKNFRNPKRLLMHDPKINLQINRFSSVDFLRGVAILAVVFHHAPFSNRLSASELKQSLMPEFVEGLLYFGKYGVQLFLVISGFSIHMFWAATAQISQKIDFKSFWKKRLLRLYPPYAFTLLLTLISAWVFHSVLTHSPENVFFANLGFSSWKSFLWGISSLILMFQNFTDAGGLVGNGPLWSLALEEQLYFLYFPFLYLRRKYGWLWALAIPLVISLAAAAMGGLRPPQEFDWWYASPLIYWFGWILGALASEYALGRITIPRIFHSKLLFAILLILAVFSDLPKQFFPQTLLYPFRGWFHCAAFFILINILIRTDSKFEKFRIIRLLGTACFGIYLVHVPAMVLAKQILLRLHVPMYAVFFGRVIFALLAGLIFYRIVEKFFHNKSRNIKIKLLNS